jgi:hypothetical protein
MYYKRLADATVYGYITIHAFIYPSIIHCYVIHPDIDHDNTSLTYQQSEREVNQQGAEREKTTVHISHPTYPLIKAEAEGQRYSVKEYINKILEQHLEKQEFLSKVVPDLSLDSLDYEINKLVIKDSRLGRLYNVYFRNFQMECETCRSSDCIHTRYAFTLDDIYRLRKYDQLPPTDSKMKVNKKTHRVKLLKTLIPLLPSIASIGGLYLMPEVSRRLA